MFIKALRDIAKPSQTEILERLKKSEGMPVSDLARDMGMSYMGVKQHCVTLEEKGYLECWRVPRSEVGVGRPEKLYRLTEKADPLFPNVGPELTLEFMRAVRAQFGENAPEKLLLRYFQERKESWQKKVSVGQTLLERATRLVGCWEKTGASLQVRQHPEEGLRIDEFHNPLHAIYQEYPNARRFEVQILAQLLGTQVTSEERQLGKAGLRQVYLLAPLSLPS